MPKQCTATNASRCHIYGALCSQFWIEEVKGHVDYRGYIRPRTVTRGTATTEDDRVLSVQV